MFNTRISTTLSRCMLAIFAILMLFGIFMGIYDITHKSYIIAFSVSFILFLIISRYGDRIHVVENVWLLTGICLAVNTAWCFIYTPVQTGDYDIFLRYATLLAFGDGTAQLSYVEMFPHIFGYSHFLSLFLRFFDAGYGVIGAGLNVLLTTGSGLMIYTIVKDFYGKQSACKAYILWIICPSVILYNVFCLSEPYYTALILLFILLIEKCSRSDKKFLWIFGIAAGVILRLIQNARPIAVILIIALVIWLIALKGFKKMFIPFIVLMLAVYIPTGYLHQEFMESKLLHKPSDTLPGYNIYVGLDSEHGGTFCNEDMDMLLNYYYGGGNDATAAQQNMLNDAIEMVKSGKTDFLSLIPNKFAKFLGCDEGGAYYSSSDFSDTWFKAASFLSNVWYYLVVMLSVRGAYSIARRKDLNALQLAPLYVIGLILAQMLVEVSGRYHYSILPMLILLAAAYKKSAHD